MEILNSDAFTFIGFPRSASEIIYNCIDYHQRLQKLNYTQPEHSLYSSTNDYDNYRNDALISSDDTLEINYLNESYSSTMINSNCPGLRSQSTVAHISMAVATITMLIHFILVTIVNNELKKLYGVCLIIVILFNALHSGILFASAYMPTTISFNLTEKEITYFIKKNLFFNCWFMDVITHYLILSIYLGIFFGLIERYRCINQYFKRPSITLKSFNALFRKHRRRNNSSTKMHNEWFTDPYTIICGGSCHSSNNNVTNISSDNKVKNQCKIFKKLDDTPKNHERRTRFLPQKDKYFEQNRNRMMSTSHRLVFNDLNIQNNRTWNITVIAGVLCLPILPTGYGVWASYYLSLNSVWNPSYGIITCGNLGGCLAAHQLLMHMPIAFLCLGIITLIILISIKTDTNCLIPEQLNVQSLDANARFRMLTKIAISHTIVWITAFLSNYICHAATWQFYGLVIALQSLYIIVSFAFSRPFLEVIFKRDDPLSRLKLDNLAMQLPLGVFRGHGSVSTTTNLGGCSKSPFTR
uniref:G_PROTEIN_RECEP_F1_2 domain-containing protein n=1 Tax=Trichobilharzia regenti TaxID=157069 RepID=A0AA85JJS9_TRIRE|nr:unnamed protein product [Trichobilharzia regenti]